MSLSTIVSFTYDKLYLYFLFHNLIEGQEIINFCHMITKWLVSNMLHGLLYIAIDCATVYCTLQTDDTLVTLKNLHLSIVTIPKKLVM